MKLYLAILLAGLSAATASAQTFEATVNTPKRKTAPAPAVRQTHVDGVIPRAAQGNPLQMLNPNAPPQYGRAEDRVILDPETGKWRGIKLFEIWW